MNLAAGAGKPALQVIHLLRAPFGGLFRHVCDLVEEQERAGLKTGVICAAAHEDPVSQARMQRLHASCSLGVHMVDMPRMPGLGDMTALRQIAPVVRRIMPDIIHGHGAKGGAYARLLPRACGGARIYTPHGGALHFSRMTPQGFAFLIAEKMMAERTDGFIFESEFSRQAFIRKIGHPAAPAEIVHNGIAEEEFEPVVPGPDAADFLFIGEMRRLKGVATLIKAASLIGFRVHIRMVGDGPDRAEFERLAAQTDAGIRIDFLGSMPARKAFALARAVVLPSYHESLPYVALEAAGAGVPLIATRVGGLAEIFGKAANRLVRPNDAPALAVAMRQVMWQREEAQAQADAMRQRVRHEFSLSRMAGGVENLYAKILRARSEHEGEADAAKGQLKPEATP